MPDGLVQKNDDGKIRHRSVFRCAGGVLCAAVPDRAAFQAAGFAAVGLCSPCALLLQDVFKKYQQAVSGKCPFSEMVEPRSGTPSPHVLPAAELDA